jgi:thiamine transporter ThiT
MNWKTIGELSLFGLAMGIATVFVIPSTIEPLFWIAIFAISAYVIARRCPARPFLHGVLVGLANSVWVTSSHVLFFHQYIANHPQEAAMMSSMPALDSPRLLMALVGPAIGIVSGLLIGLLAVIAGKVLGRRPATV